MPVDSNSPSLGISDYLNAVSTSLGKNSKSVVFGSAMVGRLFDFLKYDTDVPFPNLFHLQGDANSGQGLLGFVTQFSDILTAALATVTVQAVVNACGSNPTYNSSEFLGDLLTGVLNAVQGTIDSDLSDHTDIGSKSGTVGWGSGMPGRGLEIAIDPEVAFSFIQKVLIDEVMNGMMIGQNKPLLGYMSVRVCQPTKTLMGMQQFKPFTVMIEVVGYRSPEASAVIDEIQRRVIELSTKGNLSAMLHWGLENDQLTQNDLQSTPVSEKLNPTSAFTKLSAFQAVRQFLLNGNAPCFDNFFVQRLGL